MATRGRATRPGRGVPVRKVESGRVIARVVVSAVAITVIVFAVQGGEYGTMDLLRQRQAIALARARVGSLEASVARLRVELRAVETDPATQERIAREEFGMVRGDRELLYRFTDSADGNGDGDGGRTDGGRTP